MPVPDDKLPNSQEEGGRAAWHALPGMAKCRSQLKVCACVQDAVGNRVTVVLQNGEAVRVALPFAPVGPLPRLALDALQQVLPTGLYHSLATKQLLSPGSFQNVCRQPSPQTLYLLILVCAPFTCLKRFAVLCITELAYTRY